MKSSTRLLFLDDAEQLDCPRDGMTKLVAVGGVSVAIADAATLNSRIDKLCYEQFGFPKNEPFKWSPRKGNWFRDGLPIEQKRKLFESVLRVASEYDVTALVVACDPSCGHLKGGSTAELGALLGVLERFEFALGKNDHGVVVVDRPAGDRSDEEKYLIDCLDMVESGSGYSSFSRLACPIVSMPFKLSRVLQIADLVVSITTAHVAGRRHAASYFPHLKPLFPEDKDRIGGVGVKLHPDYKFVNLYHWLLGDSHYVRGSVGHPMPLQNRPYRASDQEYSVNPWADMPE